MASAVLESVEQGPASWRSLDIRIIPGLSAMQAAASKVGAPLGHDFCVISLSDRLKPWEIIVKRLEAVAAADFALAIYNPISSERLWQLAEAKSILATHRGPQTPVVLARSVGRSDERILLTDLEHFDPAAADNANRGPHRLFNHAQPLAGQRSPADLHPTELRRVIGITPPQRDALPNPWLSIVGIGEEGWDGLSAEAKRTIESAELLYGGSRHLGHIPAAVSRPTRVPWPSPMAPAVAQILQQHRGQRQVTVLASGDPMLHGVGVTLSQDLVPRRVSYSFRTSPPLSLACARLGWPLADVTLVSLVTRPAEQVLRHLAPGQRLVLYSKDGSTPAVVARLLTQSGYGSSQLHVFENLGAPRSATPANKPLPGPPNAAAT